MFRSCFYGISKNNSGLRILVPFLSAAKEFCGLYNKNAHSAFLQNYHTETPTISPFTFTKLISQDLFAFNILEDFHLLNGDFIEF